MNTGRTIFSQIMDFISLSEFRKCVTRYKGDYKVQNFTCLEQFLCMAFAQLTFRESLRDIEACLRSFKNKLYHIGIRSKISRSTLADANNKRDWRIYADFAQILIHQARHLYADEDFVVELDSTVYALDSTIIDLCLSMFPWAKYCSTQAGVKVNTLLDLRGNIPSFVEITSFKFSDVEILDILIPEPGSFYIMDRGYLDFKRLFYLSEALAFFIVRSRFNIRLKRLYSNPVDKIVGLRCDQIVKVSGGRTKGYYPDKLRKVVFYDKEHKKRYIFLTNNFQLPALSIANLYKQRWQIELFFKWIKQHLRIKRFFGTSENAIKTQIWIAIAVYVLIAIIKKRLKIKTELYIILQILSVSIFEKDGLSRRLSNEKYKEGYSQDDNQLELFKL